MSTTATISVVIPCFDYEEFVGAAIDSVLASSRPADEIVVVDDGSRDRSAVVAEAYAGVTLVRKENGGMASALNQGIAQSTGDIVVLLDADDLMSPDRLAWVERSFAEPKVVMAWHRLVVVDDKGAEHGLVPPTPLPGGDLVPQIAASGFASFAVTSGVAIRRSVLDAIGPIPEDEFRNFAEAYLIRATPFEGLVAATDEPLGTYRAHSGSDMRRALSADATEMAVKLAKSLGMADAEQRHLCSCAHAAGIPLTLAHLHAHDAVYRDLFLAHARLDAPTRREAWRRGRQLDLAGAPLRVRAGAAVRLAVYTVVPAAIVARHQLVAGGAPGLTGAMRVWSALYWRILSITRRG